MRSRSPWLIVPLFLALASCAFMERAKDKLPLERIAPRTAGATKALVIVLPGYGDTLATLRRSKIAETIQQGMPEAEVVLVQFSLPYYMEAQGMRRLEEEVVRPARQRGVGKIFLAGASMGGMGVLIYEREHPGAMAGLILMAPFMGDEKSIEEIQAAGGLSVWDPGPQPTVLTRDNTPRENWRLVKSWVADPQRAKKVFLICGDRDKFYAGSKLIAAVLPTENYFSPAGGHGWKVWNVGAAQAFARIGALEGH